MMNVFEYLNEISLSGSNASEDEVRMKGNIALSMLQAIASGNREREDLLDMFDRKVDLYLIAEEGQPGSFWSNADGFVESGFAFFSEDETRTLDLPMGGRWTSLKDVLAACAPTSDTAPKSH